MKELRLKKTANAIANVSLFALRDYFKDGEEAYSICNIDNETLFIRKEKNATIVDSYLLREDEELEDWETICTLKEANKIIKEYGYKIIKEVV